MKPAVERGTVDPENLSKIYENLRNGKTADCLGSPVEAEDVRNILLGRKQEVGTSCRCVIKNAVFAKKLDLSDGRLSDGAPLPAIEFQRCEFKEGFCADGAHLERLRFFCCKFTAPENVDNLEWPDEDETRRQEFECSYNQAPVKLHTLRKPKNCVSMRNCRVETELRIEKLEPIDCEGKHGLLTIDAFAARVGTNVHISDTVLRAQRGESGNLSEEAHYALHLATATIAGDVQLWPNVVLEGGLKMRDAQVGGSSWANGLQATDGEDLESRSRLIVAGNTPRKAFGLIQQTSKAISWFHL